MPWKQIERDWPRFAPRVRRHWFRLTDADVGAVNGDRELLIARIEARYGFAHERAAKEVDAWAWLVTARAA